MPVTIGVLKETVRGENRVAIVPEVATRLAGAGARVLIERGAGAAARFPDAQYKDATLADGADAVLAAADLLFTVQPPDAALVAKLKPGAAVAGFLAPHNQAALVRALKDAAHHQLRHGAGAAHLARAVDGCAVLAGGGRRLQGRADRLGRARQVLPDADDRRRARSARPPCW